MKKILAILLAVALLTACGNTRQPDTEVSGTEEYEYNGPTVNFPITEEQATEFIGVTEGEYQVLDYNSWDDDHRAILFGNLSYSDSPCILVDIRGKENEPIGFMNVSIIYNRYSQGNIDMETAEIFNKNANEQLNDILYNCYGYSDIVAAAWADYIAFADKAEDFEGVRIIFVQQYGNTTAKIISTREDTQSPYMLGKFTLATEEWEQKAETSSAAVVKNREGYTVFDSVSEITSAAADAAFYGEAEFELKDFEYTKTMPQELADGAYKNVPMGVDGYITATLSDGKTSIKCFVSPEVSRSSEKSTYQFAVIPAEQPVVCVVRKLG